MSACNKIGSHTSAPSGFIWPLIRCLCYVASWLAAPCTAAVMRSCWLPLECSTAMWLIGVSGRQILGCAVRRIAASAAPVAVAAPAAAVCCEPTHRGTWAGSACAGRSMLFKLAPTSDKQTPSRAALMQLRYPLLHPLARLDAPHVTGLGRDLHRRPASRAGSHAGAHGGLQGHGHDDRGSETKTTLRPCQGGSSAPRTVWGSGASYPSKQFCSLLTVHRYCRRACKTRLKHACSQCLTRISQMLRSVGAVLLSRALASTCNARNCDILSIGCYYAAHVTTHHSCSCPQALIQIMTCSGSRLGSAFLLQEKQASC